MYINESFSRFDVKDVNEIFIYFLTCCSVALVRRFVHDKHVVHWHNFVNVIIIWTFVPSFYFRFGSLQSVRCLPEKYCAFVNFVNKDCAGKAMQALQVKTFLFHVRLASFLHPHWNNRFEILRHLWRLKYIDVSIQSVHGIAAKLVIPASNVSLLCLHWGVYIKGGWLCRSIAAVDDLNPQNIFSLLTHAQSLSW